MNIFKGCSKEELKIIADYLEGTYMSEEKVDLRYNQPKGDPKTKYEKVTETIENTPIYKEVQDHILNAQRRQVAYGMDKYPEPLNKDSWSTSETIDHIIEETIDQLHYLVMLKMKLDVFAKNEELMLKQMKQYAEHDDEALANLVRDRIRQNYF